MYKIIFEKNALRFLGKLDKKIGERIWDKIQDCKLDPFRYLKPLVDIMGYKLRVGNYRIIIDVKEEVRVLQILKIGHRKNIYD